MGSYLNPGSKGFQESLNSEIYVDKTGLIEKDQCRFEHQTEVHLCQSSSPFRQVDGCRYASRLL